MKTLLMVLSSIQRQDGQSSRLAQRYVAAWQQADPAGRVLVRDLAETPVPHLDAQMLAALATPAEQRSEPQRRSVAYADSLIAELQAADEVVIALPMYNFGVPSTLKAWFDHIARAGVTFRYTATGAEGLLKGKRVHVFTARGGRYAGQPHDTQTPYVRDFLAFVGLSDVRFVHAEGLALGEDAQRASLQAAQQQIDRLLAPASDEQAVGEPALAAA